MRVGYARAIVGIAVAAALAAAPIAADDAKPFPRDAAITMLGYDPEAVPAEECASRAGMAGLMRISLLPGKSAAERVALHLDVAGLVGAARAVCPTEQDPPVLAPLTERDAKLDAETCRNARDAVRGPIAKSIAVYVADEHADVAGGFVAGVADALDAIASACDPGDYWAVLRVETDGLARRAARMIEARRCTVWRKAGFTEMKRAGEIAKAKGRIAGREHLKSRALVAMAGARNYCGADTIAESFEKTHYDLTEALINAEPDTK